jgi:hypothetical protein
MRHLAVVVAAALVFALVAPAVAQPFADVPTNHWAYDAIAELAAKGLVEGYPDGTFKGDRAMTRYEMAMVVARLLARIESIQVPAPAAPTGPTVTPTDLASIQRLVNEFRAELAALGVRVTAIEEELNAIKARLDNTRITGYYRFRYNDRRGATGASINGNPRTGNTPGTSQLPQAIQVFKLAYDGSVAPDIHLVAALLTNASGYMTFNSSGFNSQASIDNLFLDWRNAWGTPFEFWLGRFGGSVVGKTYPVQFGPFGLLMNTGGDTWEDSTADSGVNVVDGFYFTSHWADLADLHVQGVIARVNGGTGGGTFVSGEDAYGLDANVGLIPGLRFGANYVANNFTAGFPTTHLYGPGGGSVNPATARCPAGVGGIVCPAQGSGWDGYLQWDAVPGIHVDGEYASWNDSVNSSSDNGWQVNVTADLGTMLGVGHKLSAQVGYLNYGVNFYPPYGAAEADIAMNDSIYPGNAQGITAQLSFSPIDNWTVYGVGFFGNDVSGGRTENEYEAGVVYNFAPSAKITFKVRSLTMSSVEQFLLYRAQLDYSF